MKWLVRCLVLSSVETGICTAGNPGNDKLTLVAETAAKELRWENKELSKQLEEVKQRLQIPK
jgi:hypothetical protein